MIDERDDVTYHGGLQSIDGTIKSTVTTTARQKASSTWPPSARKVSAPGNRSRTRFGVACWLIIGVLIDRLPNARPCEAL
jgi:hypothetical protein